MGEIILLQAGQCGLQVGNQFWQVISREHGLDPEGNYSGQADAEKEKINVFFREDQDGKYHPRSIQFDLDSSASTTAIEIDNTNNSGGNYLKSHNLLGNGATGTGTGGCWAKGHWTEEARDLMDSVMDAVQKEAELCDSLDGIQLVHSMGGGTGAGLGTLVLIELKGENSNFSKQTITSYSIFPSFKSSASAANDNEAITIEPYNVILTLHQLARGLTDQTFCFDNDALWDICTKGMMHPKTVKPKFRDLNHLIAMTMSGITSPLRFSGESTPKINNLVPFPDLHFFIPALAPAPPVPFFENHGNGKQKSSKVAQLTHQLFDAKNWMVRCDPRSGLFFNVTTTFRGPDLSMIEADLEMLKFQNRYPNYFFEGRPDNVQSCLFGQRLGGLGAAGVLTVNSTAVQEMFSRMMVKFGELFRRKSLINFSIEGTEMVEDEFEDAESNMNDLIAEYREYGEMDGGGGGGGNGGGGCCGKICGN